MPSVIYFLCGLLKGLLPASQETFSAGNQANGEPGQNITASLSHIINVIHPKYCNVPTHK